MNSKFKENLNLVLIFINETIIYSFKTFINNVRKIYRKNKKHGIFYICLLVLIIGVIGLTSYILIVSTLKNNNQNEISNIYNENKDSLAKNVGSVITEQNTITGFTYSYKQALEFFTPIFNGFISNTADPTGITIKKNHKYLFSINANERIFFENGDSTLSAKKYFTLSLEIVIPFLILMIVFESFNYISNPRKGTEIKEMKSSTDLATLVP